MELSNEELEFIKEQYETLIEAGSMINHIYQHQTSELIHDVLEQSLDSLTAAYKFYRILLGLETNESNP